MEKEMIEEIIKRQEKRERRFQFFLRVSAVFHILALCVFFFLVWLGGIFEALYVGLAFFGIGSLFSGIAGLHSDFTWYVTEKVVLSPEKREELLKLCEELE